MVVLLVVVGVIVVVVVADVMASDGVQFSVGGYGPLERVGDRFENGVAEGRGLVAAAGQVIERRAERK